MNGFRPIAFFVLVVFLAACAAGQNETPPTQPSLDRPVNVSTATPPPTNLARNSEVTASAQTQTDLPGNAVDGNAETVWNAGAGPAQWIQINLGTAAMISSIRLTPC